MSCQKATLWIPLVMEESGFTGRPSLRRPSVYFIAPLLLFSSCHGRRSPPACHIFARRSLSPQTRERRRRWQNGELNPLSLWRPRTDGTSCLLSSFGKYPHCLVARFNQVVSQIAVIHNGVIIQIEDLPAALKI